MHGTTAIRPWPPQGRPQAHSQTVVGNKKNKQK